MMVRASVFRELNGLDSNFFAHMEEIDFCWRIQLAGKHVYYCPDSKVYHVGGGSLPKSNPKKTYLNFRNNLLLIYKNSSPKQSRRILRRRFFLDILASILFLFSGSMADTRAVWRARRDFKQLKKQYSNKKGNNNDNYKKVGSLIYPNCIVWDYYLWSRKKFTSLKWKQ